MFQLAIAVFLLCLFVPDSKGFDLITYIPEWRNRIDLNSLVGRASRINLFSLEIDPSTGKLIKVQERLPSKRSLADVREHIIATGHDMKICVSIGGWNRSLEGFAAISTTKEKADAFVTSLFNVVDDYQFDCVDFDWEFPKGNGQWKQFASLLRYVKQSRPTLPLSLAYSSYYRNEPFIKNFNIHEVIDVFNMMAFDAPGKHSTLEYAESVIKKWKTLGLPIHKVNLGVPFYGRDMKSKIPSSYKVIVRNKGVEDPNQDEVGTIYFNGPSTIRAKIKLAKRYGMAGVMIWEIGQDVSYTHPMSLFHAAVDEINQ